MNHFPAFLFIKIAEQNKILPRIGIMRDKNLQTFKTFYQKMLYKPFSLPI